MPSNQPVSSYLTHAIKKQEMLSQSPRGQGRVSTSSSLSRVHRSYSPQQRLKPVSLDSRQYRHSYTVDGQALDTSREPDYRSCWNRWRSIQRTLAWERLDSAIIHGALVFAGRDYLKTIQNLPGKDRAKTFNQLWLGVGYAVSRVMSEMYTQLPDGHRLATSLHVVSTNLQVPTIFTPPSHHTFVNAMIDLYFSIDRSMINVCAHLPTLDKSHNVILSGIPRQDWIAHLDINAAVIYDESYGGYKIPLAGPLSSQKVVANKQERVDLVDGLEGDPTPASASLLDDTSTSSTCSSPNVSNHSTDPSSYQRTATPCFSDSSPEAKRKSR